MLENAEEFNGIVHTVKELVKAGEDEVLKQLLTDAVISIDQTDHDNWNGGIDLYTVYVVIDVKVFVSVSKRLTVLESALYDQFIIATRHLEGESIRNIQFVPKTNNRAPNMPDPHRPFSGTENKKKEDLAGYLKIASEDDFTNNILLPLFRQLGFHRITSAGHKDKALEYGKDIWMKYTLPTQHVLYFGVQVKVGKIDSAGASRNGNANVAEIHNQLLMMVGHTIFDPEIGKRVLVDHAFIVAAGDITKGAKNWLGEKLDASKRSQIIFMDKEDILNLYIVSNLPLPASLLNNISPKDDLPF